MASGLLDKANIILTPTGYKAGTMYNVAPIEQPYEDFVFSRASVASRVNSSGLVEMVGRTLGSNLVQNGDFSELGPDLVQNGTFDLGSELVTNGDFATDSDWTKGTGWSISGGVATASNVPNLQRLQQDIGSSVVGKTYKYSFNISNVSGAYSVYIFGGYPLLSVNTEGLVEGYATATSTNGVIWIAGATANGLISATIDNVSVKEVPDWTLGTGWSVENNKAYFDNSTGTEITQSLSTTANTYKINFDLDLQSGSCRVYFNSPGISTQITLTSSGNKTAYVTTTTNHTKFTIAGTGGSEFNITNVSVKQVDPNDYWTLQNNTGTNTEITSGHLIIETDGAYTQVSQSSVLVAANQYKLVYTISSSDNGDLGLVIDGNITVSIPSSVGTHTYYFTSHSTSLVLKRRGGVLNVTITNVSVQEVIDTNNIPRINYDSNGENGHWLLEPTSTNLVTYSEDFSQWTLGSNSTLTYESDVVAPDGSLGVYRLTNPATSSTYIQSPLFTYNNPITLSIYAKYADASNNEFDLYDGTNTTRKITTSEWQRFDAVGFGNQLTIVNSGDTYITDIYIWGGQAEALPYATSYIPTLTGSTETRATETATGAGSADLINSTEGVLYAEMELLQDVPSANMYFGISSGALANSIFFRFNTLGDIFAYNSGLGSSNIIASKLASEIDLTNYFKLALKYGTTNSDFSVYVNGVELTQSGSFSATAVSGLSKLDFALYDGTSSPFYGKCKELVVFGEALSDDELEKLTSWSSFNAMATDLGYTIE
jgi:hypothetical protein